MAGGRVRRYLNQEINPWPILLGAAAMIAILTWFASAGRGGLGLLVIVGATVLWSVADRLRPGRTVEMHEVAHYTSDCNRVWNLIKPPEKAPLLHPNIRRGYQVPGTPDGVGEQQAFELDNGIMMVLEVTELTPGVGDARNLRVCAGRKVNGLMFVRQVSCRCRWWWPGCWGGCRCRGCGAGSWRLST